MVWGEEGGEEHETCNELGELRDSLRMGCIDELAVPTVLVLMKTKSVLL